MSRISSWAGAALLLGCTALYADANRFQLEYAKDFPFRGGRVTVDHSFGSVVVDTDSGSVVHVRATIRASDPEYGKEIRVVAEERGGGVSIRTEYPSRFIRMKHASYSVDYRITVPEGAPVDVKNKYGSIEASGVTSGSFVDAYGSIHVRDVKGAQRIENSFGSIEARNVGGPANISNKYGPIRAYDLGGDVAVNTAFGPVEIANVRGNVDVATQNANVSVRHIEGWAKIGNAFGAVRAEDIKGNADVRTQNGRVDLAEVGGNATVNTSFGGVELRDIGGNITVRTGFGSVFGHGLGGAIDIKNQYGAIAVSEISPKCRPISLVTSFSSIRIGLPANASYTVSAKTSNGRISSALPITTKTMREDTLAGTIGNGGCPMELVNSNGAITIEKE